MKKKIHWAFRIVVAIVIPILVAIRILILVVSVPFLMATALVGKMPEPKPEQEFHP